MQSSPANFNFDRRDSLFPTAISVAEVLPDYEIANQSMARAVGAPRRIMVNPAALSVQTKVEILIRNTYGGTTEACRTRLAIFNVLRRLEVAQENNRKALIELHRDVDAQLEYSNGLIESMTVMQFNELVDGQSVDRECAEARINKLLSCHYGGMN